MMHRPVYIVILLLVTFSWSGHCQKKYDCYNVNELNAEPLLTGELFSPASSPDIVTYFNKTWLPAEIWLTDGTMVSNKMIKYNGLLDEILMQEPVSNQVIMLDKGALARFHFYNITGDTAVYFRKLRIKPNFLSDSAEIYCEEIFQGELSLFISHAFYLDHKERVKYNNSIMLKDVYREDPVYYLVYSDNQVTEFKNFNRKRLYKFLPGEKEQIKKFFREYVHGRIDTRPELIQLMQFLSSVVEQ